MRSTVHADVFVVLVQSPKVGDLGSLITPFMATKHLYGTRYIKA